MKLAKLEKRLLTYIDSEYPVVWKESDKDRILALGERKLPTFETIISTFKNDRDEVLRRSIESLINYQYLKKVNLLDRSDFVELTLAPGMIQRCAVAKHGKATIGLQITQDGKNVIETFWTTKGKQLLGKWGTKISEDYAPIIFAFVVGYLLNEFFGIDLKKLLGR